MKAWVFWQRLTPDTMFLGNYRKLFSEHELQRVDASNTDAGKLFIHSHLLLRHVLAAALHIAPGEIVFSATSQGKPYILVGNTVSHWRFSLTHTAGLVAVAITCQKNSQIICREKLNTYQITVNSTCRCNDKCHSFLIDLGLDVESTSRRPRVVALARCLFSARESALVESRSGQEQLSLFCRYWVLKEAFGKAIGCGMARTISQQTLVFSPPTGRPQLASQLLLPQSERRWIFTLHQASDDYLFGLAGLDITAIKWIPLPSDKKASLEIIARTFCHLS